MNRLNVVLMVSVVAVVNGASIIEDSVYIDLARLSLRAPEDYLKAIVPGTKWCGDGNIANNYNDLGVFTVMDMCCRDHDNCNDNIVAGATKYGLHNDGSYTRSHCNCDYDFYNCLDDADGMVAYIVGTGYFNALGGQCFNLTHPATCVKTQSIVGPRCVEYSYDTTKPMAWQWFDVPRYMD